MEKPWKQIQKAQIGEIDISSHLRTFRRQKFHPQIGGGIGAGQSPERHGVLGMIDSSKPSYFLSRFKQNIT